MTSKMNNELLTDRVNLIRNNGERVENIFASVQGNKIFMDDLSLLIEEGDTLTRLLTNGLEEEYLIENIESHSDPDPEFCIVEIHVRKKTRIDKSTPVSRQEFHLGNGSQVNINSPNSSVSITNITQSNIFEQLNKTIKEKVPDEETRSNLIDQVEELRITKHKKDFLERYNNFITSAANHAVLWAALSPFVPVFTGIIAGLK